MKNLQIIPEQNNCSPTTLIGQFIKKNINFYKYPIKIILILTSIFILSNVTAQNGYIYIQKKAANEESSPNFTFTVTGPSGFNQTYTLNDQPDYLFVSDIGGTSNGGLFALAGNANAAGDYVAYFKAANSSTWVATSILGTRIDGGPNNTAIFCNAAGQVYYYNGTTSTRFTGAGASAVIDVSMDKTGTGNVFLVSSANVIRRSNISSFNSAWTNYAGITGLYIDATNDGRLLYADATAAQNINIINVNGTGNTSLGMANGLDVGTSGDGGLYGMISDPIFGYVVYKWVSGTTWAMEQSSRTSGYPYITGAASSQMYMINGLAYGGTSATIFTRRDDGTWIDDERVRTTFANDAIVIPVPAGTYTIVENAVANWALQKIDIVDATANSTGNFSTATISANVAPGETVSIVVQNGLVQNFPVTNTCNSSVPIYTENFGTGAANTFGPPLTGETNCHYQNFTNVQDGYYAIVGNSATTGFGNFNDHTNNDGLGRMMFVNASYEKVDFFRHRVSGLIVGAQYDFSAWALNINNATIKPNIKFEIFDPINGTSIATSNSGDITSVGVWNQYTLSFTATQSAVDIILSNNNIGGDGNDLAIDDISLFGPKSDKGDAPNSYKTLNASGGPCHALTPLIMYGSTITAEADGQPSANANLDAGDDGLATITNMGNTSKSSQVIPSYSLTASFTNTTGLPANHVAWIDWNNDGIFQAAEGIKIITPAATTSGNVTFTWSNATLSGVAGTANTYARIELTTDAISTTPPSGLLSNGEVEDYKIPFTIVLPVTLSNFTATPLPNCAALIQWQTANELNAKQYNIEQSTDGAIFSNVAIIPNKNAQAGSSYSYKINSLFSGINYFRLKVVDADGKFTYSSIITVHSNCKAAISITPNPTSDIINIAGLQGKNSIQIINTTGQKMTEVQSIGFTQQINLATFTNGIYIVRIVDAQGNVTNNKVIKE